MGFSAVVVAAGSGSRAGGAKQWRSLAGRPVVRWPVEALLAAGADDVVVVIPADAEAELASALGGLSGWRSVTGGATRAASVRAGLADNPAVVVRPISADTPRREIVVAWRTGSSREAEARLLAETFQLDATFSSVVA